MATQQPAAAIPNLRDKLPKLEPRRRRPAPSNPLPLPETPVLPPPPDTSSYSFKVPGRRILSIHDHQLFLSSPSHNLIVAFVFGLSDAVIDTPVSAVKDDDCSPAVKSILGILDKTEALVLATPPDDAEGSRFGNKVFRTFLDKEKAASSSWHEELGLTSKDAISEVETYLNNSLGNRTRIDYGSGHELNFMIWLLCLYQLQIVKKSDFKALVLKVFIRYLQLMQTIQSTYYLEPAGSHGVWGLDDYQFLPFLFGASQLLHHPFITPLAIHQELTLEEFGHDYMYLGQVNFVNSTKTVKGLRWHSPMLDDISSAKSWTKIEGGMKRMFVAEVLRKLPVMQHFLFGSLVPAVEGMSSESEAGIAGEEDETEGGGVIIDHDGMKHVHNANSWGDCCGIKVPSAIAAAQAMRKNGAGELRRIPFD
ncbi:Phosphotyrosyl phosphatase activator [Annulohypoxylon maeteangense]|uniref:Phosphotyrosyl phosphatase activator n=1 Tax=Annulohypoxylon maeteangense TaxID=1927788 RepID=UPI002007DD61|nr:Phosphotyrosyl phosphatase activator [Annulohypoxylon maeteangense]KAI0890008.1 Phosphotyrosyl phosphatase activator [Annulohypoxylon maeteangense]